MQYNDCIYERMVTIMNDEDKKILLSLIIIGGLILFIWKWEWVIGFMLELMM